MKKILLTTDFSKNASNAVDYAIKLFGTDDVTYMLLNTYQEPRSSTNVVVSLNDFLRKESISALERESEKLIETFGKGLALEQKTHYGDLAAVINKLAEDHAFDYVAIGTKGASSMENFIMGSNTLNVVKSVNIPMFVIPENMHFEGLSRMVLAADYEHIDHIHLLDPMAHIARLHKAKVLIVNVLTQDASTDYDHANEGFELHNVLENVEHQFYSEKSVGVVEGIESFIRKKEAEILTMVARKHNFFDRLFHKSVTKEISKLADIPLLILHEK